jgi:hypothetical protein
MSYDVGRDRRAGYGEERDAAAAAPNRGPGGLDGRQDRLWKAAEALDNALDTLTHRLVPGPPPGAPRPALTCGRGRDEPGSDLGAFLDHLTGRLEPSAAAPPSWRSGSTCDRRARPAASYTRWGAGGPAALPGQRPPRRRRRHPRICCAPTASSGPLVVQRSTGYVLTGNHTMDGMPAEGWDTADVHLPGRRRRRGPPHRPRGQPHLATSAATTSAPCSTLLREVGEDLTGTGFDTDDFDDLLASLEEADAADPPGAHRPHPRRGPRRAGRRLRPGRRRRPTSAPPPPTPSTRSSTPPAPPGSWP